MHPEGIYSLKRRSRIKQSHTSIPDISHIEKEKGEGKKLEKERPISHEPSSGKQKEGMEDRKREEKV